MIKGTFYPDSWVMLRNLPYGFIIFPVFKSTQKY